MISSRIAAAAVAAVLSGGLVSAQEPTPGDDGATDASSRPNVVLLVADDLGWADVHANNPATFYETPNIDRIGARGLRFAKAYAASPVCSPSRASLMTGKYPPRTAITDYIGAYTVGKLIPPPTASHLGLEEVTIAEAFRGAGFPTFFAGKWHLGYTGYGPNAQGFGPGLAAVGGTTPQFWYPCDSPSSDATADPKSTDRIADAAVRFIAANRDRPFFAYVPFGAVHIPLGAPPDLVAKYVAKKASAPPDAWGLERDSRVRLVQSEPTYAAMVEQLDAAVGRIVAALDEYGLTQRTVILFTSDNGGLSTAEGRPTSNVPLRAGKGWLYEGGLRVPFLVRGPGIVFPGRTSNVPVIGTDVYPTLLEIAGLPLRPEQHRDGVSLVPVFRNGSLPVRQLFWHYPHYGNQGGAPAGAIRERNWKLVEWFEDGSVELYDLTADPGETRDLADEAPAKRQDLLAKLAAWRAAVGAKMPTANPSWP